MFNVAYITLTSEFWAYLVIVPTGASVQHVGHPTSCKACQGECEFFFHLDINVESLYLFEKNASYVCLVEQRLNGGGYIGI